MDNIKDKSEQEKIDENEDQIENNEPIKIEESSKTSKKGRKLGDEWDDWDGSITDDNVDTNATKGVFLSFALAVILITNFIMYTVYYFITPRLREFYIHLPMVVLIVAVCVTIFLFIWFMTLIITSYTGFKLHILNGKKRLLFDLVLDKVFQLGDIIGYSKDKLGNSFIRVSNSFVRSTKKPNDNERILLLLPRCLTRETYSESRRLSRDYNIEMAIVGGGEAARKKIREYRPTAVVAVACERDLISGIKDIGNKISVLGITNLRPEGPCKNTCINYDELRNSIQFYLSSKNNVGEGSQGA